MIAPSEVVLITPEGVAAETKGNSSAAASTAVKRPRKPEGNVDGSEPLQKVRKRSVKDPRLQDEDDLASGKAQNVAELASAKGQRNDLIDLLLEEDDDDESAPQKAQKREAEDDLAPRKAQKTKDGQTAGPSAEPKSVAAPTAKAEFVTRKPGWIEVIGDVEKHTFVGHRRGAFSKDQLDAWRRLCNDRLNWSRPLIGGVPLPRDAAWVVTDGCTCNYQYATVAFAPNATEEWFRDMTKAVCDACGITDLPNCCNMNRYVGGWESVGWHADDEDLFDALNRNARIISLTLGASRWFQFRPTQQGSGHATCQVSLGDGDLCIMEGKCQKYYQHCVPKQPEVQGSRINLTWRWIVKHQKDCPMGMPEGPYKEKMLKVATTRFDLDRMTRQKEYAAKQKEKFADVRKQIVYYFSDANLKHDKFFHERISSDPGGWLSMDIILGCKKMQAMHIDKDEVVEALKDSPLEIRDDKGGIRRPGNQPLPELEEKGKGKGKKGKDKGSPSPSVPFSPGMAEQDRKTILKSFSDEELIMEIIRRGIKVTLHDDRTT